MSSQSSAREVHLVLMVALQRETKEELAPEYSKAGLQGMCKGDVAVNKSLSEVIRNEMGYQTEKLIQIENYNMYCDCIIRISRILTFHS